MQAMNWKLEVEYVEYEEDHNRAIGEARNKRQ